MRYTKKRLSKLDKELEMIPLYFDQMFKAIMMKNSEVFKRFLIDTLRLNIGYDKSEIIFLNNEFPKDRNMEKGKVIDIHVRIDNRFTIDCEMNYYYDDEVMAKSSVYMDKFRGSFIEINESYKDIFEYDFYQLNLNKSSRLYPDGENIIVSYNITKDTIFPDHKKVVLKNLDYYLWLYYNKGRNLSFDELFMVALLSNNFSELNDVLSKILNRNEKDKFLESVINMSSNSISLHAWQKEKLDKWEKWHRDKRLDEREDQLNERITELNERTTELDERTTELDERTTELDERTTELDEREDRLDEREDKLRQDKIDMIKRLLEKKMSYEEISYIVGVSSNEVRTIVEKEL